MLKTSVKSLPPAITTETTTAHIVITDSKAKDEDNGLIPLEVTKNFRINCKRLFITFPQTDTLKDDAAEKLKSNTKTNDCSFIVAQERHQDGNTHLHVYIEKPSNFNFRDPKYFDFITGKHGNIQKVRSKEAVIGYVCKEGEFICHKIDPSAIIQKMKMQQEKKRKRESSTKSHKIFEYLKNGNTYQDLLKNDELGSFLVLHGNDVKRLAHDFQVLKEKEERERIKPQYCRFIMNDMEYDMLVNLPFKSKQFWIWGSANVGKSTFIRKLEDVGLRGFEIPTNNDFAEWEDDRYDFAYIDEFKGQLTIQFLNMFLQGSKMRLPGKYVIGGKLKNKNVPIFILSNYTPEEVYHKKSARDLEPLLTRLKVIELKSFNDYEIITTPQFDTNGSPIYLTDLYCDENDTTTS